ncbi:NUC188 domain-containing protein [Gongronella butleri]|nr:NUC188 domain-containing protein [Gongronella butleri]
MSPAKGKRAASPALQPQDPRLDKKSKHEHDQARISVRDEISRLDAFYKDLPKISGNIDAEQFLASRMGEVTALQAAIKTTSKELRVPAFERLPRFLRRRAASHNLHHLRARDRLKLSIKLANGKQVRKSMRKIKSAVLLEELRSQKAGVQWLETHKWHIKRMKMQNWWGYRLAARPMFKARITNYRSFTKICLLHDASYYGCIELTGVERAIVQLMDTMTDPRLPSVGSQRYLKGTRCGSTFVYDQGAFPCGLICPITFVWRAAAVATKASLWVWVHPACFNDILKQMDSIKSSLDDARDVKISDLRKQLVRFDLTGARSTALLQAVLTPIASSANADLWMQLQGVRSAACLPANCVLGLSVQDPRLRFPQKAKPVRDMGIDARAMLDLCTQWPTTAASSDIWSSTKRRECVESKVSHAQLQKRRQQMLLPGGKLAWTSGQDNAIPVILMRRPQVEGTGHGMDAWTLVLPRTYGMDFWRSFVFAGARVGGVEDMRHMCLDVGRAAFPYDYAMTRAYDAVAAIQSTAKERAWHARPPAKRVNYAKLGVLSPFSIPVATLARPGRTIGGVLPFLVKDDTSMMDTPKSIDLLVHVRVWSAFDTDGGVFPEGARIYASASNEDDGKRTPIGYVTSGDYSFMTGQGQGIGVCLLEPLQHLWQQKQDTMTVWIQKLTSRHCRRAHLELIKI